jgi:hypothetical protein
MATALTTQARKQQLREPLEVQVTDFFTGQKLVCEYKGEMKRKGAEPRYKVYSPFFADAKEGIDAQLRAHRWVKKIRIFGSAPSEKEINEFFFDEDLDIENPLYLSRRS